MDPSANLEPRPAPPSAPPPPSDASAKAKPPPMANPSAEPQELRATRNQPPAGRGKGQDPQNLPHYREEEHRKAGGGTQHEKKRGGAPSDQQRPPQRRHAEPKTRGNTQVAPAGGSKRQLSGNDGGGRGKWDPPHQ